MSGLEKAKANPIRRIKNGAEAREVDEWGSSKPKVPFHAYGLNESRFAGSGSSGGSGDGGGGGVRGSGTTKIAFSITTNGRRGLWPPSTNTTTTQTGSSTTKKQSEVPKPADPTRGTRDGNSGAARSAAIMAYIKLRCHCGLRTQRRLGSRTNSPSSPASVLSGKKTYLAKPTASSTLSAPQACKIPVGY